MIDLVFEELKSSGFVKSGNEFSREWLGMEESYMRVLRAKKRQPSAKVLARCANRLKQTGDALSSSAINQVLSKGQKCHVLADLCVKEILRVS
jgi:hypothetical protein